MLLYSIFSSLVLLNNVDVSVLSLYNLFLTLMVMNIKSLLERNPQTLTGNIIIHLKDGLKKDIK